MERQSYIKALSQFVLSLSEQDKNSNPLEILQWSIPQLTRIVGADSSWAGWLDLTEDAAYCCYSVTSNLPSNFEQIWWTIRRDDILAQDLVNRCPSAVYDRQGARNSDGMVTFCDNFAINKAAAVVSKPGNGPISMFMSAYRSGRRSPLLESDALDFLRCALDHIRSAILRCGASNDQDGVLLANLEGRILTASESAVRMLERHWPGWRRGYLPTELRESLSSSRKLHLAKRGVAVGCRQTAHISGRPLRLLSLRPAGPCDQLTEREWQIAIEIVAGRTHKEIAARLSLSPATVRNRTQDILAKVGVHSKAALSNMLASTPAGATRSGPARWALQR
jgi:DNA-binding NarL/FixJ family response regulator